MSSESVSALSWAEEVFYRRLMSVADDHGRFHAAPKLIRAACYPLLIDKVSDADIGKWLTACVTAALVSVYPASDGKRYLQIIKFGQQVRAKSKFPEPSDSDAERLLAIDIKREQAPADAHLGEGGGGGDVSTEPNGSVSSAVPTDRRPRLPSCPYDRVVALYHEVLPELPRVKVMDEERKAVIAKLWRFILTSPKSDGKPRAQDPDGGLAWLRGYFEHARANDFVMGRTARSEEHRNWKASLDYLCSNRGVKQVLEKTEEVAA